VVQLVSLNLFIFQALLNSYGFVTGKGKTLERVPEVSGCVQRSFFVARFSAHLAAIIFGAV
jgi:hypothetical protein